MKSHALRHGDPRHHSERIAELKARMAELEGENERLRAENTLLRDALGEFHEFVTEHLDPDPHPIEAYLCWRRDQVVELRRVLAGSDA